MDKSKIKPHNFYKIARVMRDFNKKDLDMLLSTFVESTSKLAAEISIEHERLFRSNSNIMQEIRNATRNDPFKSIEQQEVDMSNWMPEIQGSSFLRVVLKVFEQLDNIWNSMVTLAEQAKPEELFINDYDRSPLVTDANQRHLQLMEMEWNMSSVSVFVENVEYIADLQVNLYKSLEIIARVLEKFYEFVNHRHSVDGMKIYRDPIVTDVAISVFENIDAHGEIANGKKPEEVSSYTEGKALAIAATVKGGKLFSIIENPESFQEFIQRNISAIKAFGSDLQNMMQEITHDVCLAVNHKPNGRITEADWNALIQRVKDANVASITDKSEEKLLSPQERFAAKFRNETLDNLVKLIVDPTASVRDVVMYVLKRKAEMRQYNQNENSFYTCRISAGNPFAGQAPGALEVIAAEKPSTKLEHIIGSGFGEVREFVKGIDGAVKWHDLFLATSPRKKVDRQHLLMVGPQGCGKTEIMRAVANHEGSVAIFAQGSDFLTCWKGEDLKNPKRLFQQALKIQKDTKKHVHIMIDEIDAVLNSDRSSSDTNLTLEFQILMDGMISYPHISVWGATNNLARIPMPMIRRFKVLIVGELSQTEIKSLLKHYLGFLPCNISDEELSSAAAKLEGCTGDIIAKISENLWREKMVEFVANHKKPAETLTDFLNENGQFNIREFDEKQRHNFLQRLKDYVVVSAEDLDSTINSALNSIGVMSEIETAINTYAASKLLISSMQRDG